MRSILSIILSNLLMVIYTNQLWHSHTLLKATFRLNGVFGRLPSRGIGTSLEQGLAAE